MSRRARSKVASSQKRKKPSESLGATHPSSPIIVLVDADTHFGSVLSPVTSFIKSNGQRETPSKEQQHLADERSRLVDFFVDLKHKKQASLIYVHCGDVVEGIKHKSKQRISDDPGDQIELARLFLRPLCDMADKIIGIRGTEAHDGIGNEYGEAVFSEWKAKMWGPEGWPALTVYRALVEIGGLKFDFEHHIDGASRPWTRGGNIQRRVVSSVYEMLVDKINAADYVFRAHTHDGFDTGANPPFPHGVICRPWKGRGDAFGHRIASVMPTILGSQYVVIEEPGQHYFRWWDCLNEGRSTWHPVKVGKR